MHIYPQFLGVSPAAQPFELQLEHQDRMNEKFSIADVTPGRHNSPHEPRDRTIHSGLEQRSTKEGGRNYVSWRGVHDRDIGQAGRKKDANCFFG